LPRFYVCSAPFFHRSSARALPDRQWVAGPRAAGRLGLSGAAPEPDLNRGAGAGLAVEGDGRAVAVDDPLADRKSQTAAAHLATAGLVDREEALEEVGQILRRNADAGVPHLDHRLRFLFPCLQPDAAARRRIFDGIVQQVQEELPQAQLVADGL